MESIFIKTVGSYNKCFDDTKADDYKDIKSASMLLGDTYAFQVVVSADTPLSSETPLFLKVYSDISDYVSVCEIRSVFTAMPAYPTTVDENYLREKKPGMYPDLMVPVDNRPVLIKGGKLASFWIEINTPTDARTGKYGIELVLETLEGEEAAKSHFDIEIIPAVLPKQSLIVTQWFHCDCLATYYGIEPLSEKHWEIIENFANTATKNGINVMLMPVFTPPLDTEVGGERPTVQLVRLTKNGDKYEFDFSLVDRWLDMCERCGIKYHEIAHLFTQWGAEHAPKIMAYENGEYKRIFGWETDSLSDEYIGFVRSFITEFKAYLSDKGILEKCMFHLSDEPGAAHLETFTKIREKLSDVLEGCMCAEALSNYDFYATGAVQHPIVSTDNIEPFLENNVPDLWCYYCCAQNEKVSNRFVAMTMNRTRIIGEQMYKYDIKGFLHWGYNFYYSQYSKEVLDPYEHNDGKGFGPSGDAFSVYPAPDGTAYETLHLKAFTQALYDMRAFALLESLTSKEAVLKVIDEKQPITFSDYPHDVDFSESVRQKVNELIKANI